MLEIEIKLAFDTVPQALALLADNGFHPESARGFESNTVYDFPGNLLRSRGELIRIRTTDGENLLTYKGPSLPGEHKVREEIEVGLSGAGPLHDVFQRIGLVPVFRYEKFRTRYSSQAAPEGHALLDETPIGVFLELEGPGEWIDHVAAMLGKGKSDYIKDSYGTLFEKYHAKTGLGSSNMVFQS